MPSKVYFMNDRAANIAESTPFKAVKLLRDAGIGNLFKKGDTVGIKLHMGTYGNSLNLRPHWIKYIADEVKRLGGNPVVVDSNVLHMTPLSKRGDSVINNKGISGHGFNEETMGCPVLLPEDHLGFEGEKAEIPNGVYLKHTFLVKHMAKLDAVIVVSHFKGHPMGVFGGALKNVGIGMASQLGKLTAHMYNHPEYGIKNVEVNQEVFPGLNQGYKEDVDAMIKNCPFDVYEIKDGQLLRHAERCKQCSGCFLFGFFYGLLTVKKDLPVTWPVAMVDSAAGIINKIGKNKFIFLNYAFDITPSCDCADFHDRPMVSNIGTFCSKDPVAVDMACLEAAEALAATPGSAADEFGLSEPYTERFTNCSSLAKISQWSQINAGEFNGLGTSEYVLVESVPMDANEIEPWISPYSKANPFGYVNKEAYGKVNLDPGDCAYPEARLGLPDLHKKPIGKVAEESILKEIPETIG